MISERTWIAWIVYEHMCSCYSSFFRGVTVLFASYHVAGSFGWCSQFFDRVSYFEVLRSMSVVGERTPQRFLQTSPSVYANCPNSLALSRCLWFAHQVVDQRGRGSRRSPKQTEFQVTEEIRRGSYRE